MYVGVLWYLATMGAPPPQADGYAFAGKMPFAGALLRPESRPGRGITFIDLFAGIGGTRMAFESLGCRCVYTNEWDRHAAHTYLANFGSCPDTRDIRTVQAEEIPDHDILVAGFPCQPFSIAGVSKKNALGRPHGFMCQTQGTLFYEVARIIQAKRPAAFLLENVKHLTRHDRGRTFRTIVSTLTEELGYQVRWAVLDAAAFVPQHRERTFIVGLRNDDRGALAPFTFENVMQDWPPVDVRPQLRAILHECVDSVAEPPYTEFTGRRVRVHPRYTLSTHLWAYLREYAAKHRAQGNGFGFGLVGPDNVARTLSARYYKDGSEILVRQQGRPRRLTPRECSRLMGFDWFMQRHYGRDRFMIPVSDTQAYRQFGNAVVPQVVRAVAKEMLQVLSATRGRAEDLSAHEPVKGSASLS